MPCNGLAADIYDLYVLGLLDGRERIELETHIQEQCPACLCGVQRSMDLWTVFVTTLENAEPSADFKARLIRIAELSKKVLTFPKTPASEKPSQATGWGLMAGGAAVAVLVVAAWYTGHASGALNEQRLSGDLNRLTQQIALTQVRLNEQTAKAQNLEKALQSSGKSGAADQQSLMQQRLLQAQAQAGQYKAILDREEQQVADNTRLISALSNAGAHLFALKGIEKAAGAIAYVLITENSKLLFIGANLPKPGEGRQFQLWLVRKQDPKIVSAGVFSPDQDNHVLMNFDEASVLSEVSLLEVTEEPEGGAATPSGPKLFEAARGGEE